MLEQLPMHRCLQGSFLAKQLGHAIDRNGAHVFAPTINTEADARVAAQVAIFCRVAGNANVETPISLMVPACAVAVNRVDNRMARRV